MLAPLAAPTFFSSESVNLPSPKPTQGDPTIPPTTTMPSVPPLSSTSLWSRFSVEHHRCQGAPTTLFKDPAAKPQIACFFTNDLCVACPGAPNHRRLLSIGPQEDPCYLSPGPAHALLAHYHHPLASTGSPTTPQPLLDTNSHPCPTPPAISQMPPIHLSEPIPATWCELLKIAHRPPLCKGKMDRSYNSEILHYLFSALCSDRCAFGYLLGWSPGDQFYDAIACCFDAAPFYAAVMLRMVNRLGRSGILNVDAPPFASGRLVTSAVFAPSQLGGSSPC